MASGGMGKNELSTNETSPRSHVAYGLPAALTHQSYIFLNMGQVLSGARPECPCARAASAALAGPAAFERHHLAPGGRLDRAFAQLGELLGDAEQALAALHLGPDLLGLDAGGDP